MGENIKVIEYSISTLLKLLSEYSKAIPTVVESKLHAKYFENYFNDLNAKSIVVESNYIDRDFLEDFAGYYVRCFEDLPSYCTRLHFFNIDLIEEDLLSLLINKESKLNIEILQAGYLGFVVLKPLPKAIIGRTCLKTYDLLDGERSYPITRKYESNLFGISLSIDSLAFQEQDKVAAACATSALWSTFQGTGKIYQHAIPSPVEITNLATKLPDEAVPGTLPNDGLTGRQMIYAIRQLGLEPLKVSAQDEFVLKSTIYAYLKMGIPIILVLNLFDMSDKPIYKGGAHAVTITGFREGLPDVVPFSTANFKLNATKINKLYAHDDQVGPFSRMEFDNVKVDLNKFFKNNTDQLNSLKTSWVGNDGVIGSVRACPSYLLIPLYPKIRIEFKFIRKVLFNFDKYIRYIIEKIDSTILSEIEWDVNLIRIKDFKSEIRQSTTIEDSEKQKILLQNMPRFLWRATGTYNGVISIDLIFDATGIEEGNYFIRAIKNNNSFIYRIVSIFAKTDSPDPVFQQESCWRILEWFAKQK